MIDYGVFDRFSTGKEVVEAVTNNKELVMTKWDKDIKSEIETEEIPVH